MDSLIFSSVENIPSVNARAAFTVNSAAVFREDCDVMPSTFGNIKYMPWGADNQMPYDIIDLIAVSYTHLKNLRRSCSSLNTLS